MLKKLVIRRLFYCVFLLGHLVLFFFASPAVYADYKVVYTHSHENSSERRDKEDSSDDIWRMLQKGFALNHQAQRAEVKQQIAWFMLHRKYLRAAALNARPYMYYIITQIKKRDLPLEFALLPIIESAFDPFAYSSSGAAGLWQMMPATATDFGLKQNWWYDGRRDIVASTNAALDYLVYLQNFFGGNWMFTVAAYHAGQGTILNAVKKNVARGEDTDFWSLPLGKQTQLYIPKLLALAEMISHPEKYPLDMPPIPNKPYLTQVDVGAQIDLSKAAQLSGLSLATLKNLNPGFNRWATSPDGPYLLVVPIQNESRLRDGLSLLEKNRRVTWERYDVKSGDSLAKIAAKYHTTTSVLLQVNKLESTLLHVGDVIFIPNSSTSSRSASPEKAQVLASAAASSSDTLNMPSRSVEADTVAVYTVREGDTLSSVAKTMNISWADLKNYNHLTSDRLVIGQKLNIPSLRVAAKKPVKKVTQKLRYIVQPQDTLGEIALRFGVTVADIERWNPSLKSRQVLRPKQSLFIYQSVGE